MEVKKDGIISGVDHAAHAGIKFSRATSDDGMHASLGHQYCITSYSGQRKP